MLAGALKENKCAVLFGEPTFGKGKIQSVFELSDGSGLVVTVARFITPDHTDVDKVGVIPDHPLPTSFPKDEDAFCKCLQDPASACNKILTMDLTGTVNLLLPFNGGVFVGVDSRCIYTPTWTVTTNRGQKLAIIGDLVITMTGSIKSVELVWEEIEKKVEENKMKGIRTSVDMATDYATAYVKYKSFRPFAFFIVGMQNESLKSVLFASDPDMLDDQGKKKNNNKDTRMEGQNEPVTVTMTSLKSVGTDCQFAIDMVNEEWAKHPNLMTEKQAELLSQKFLLISSLRMGGIGGMINNVKVDSSGRIAWSTNVSVIALYVSHYDVVSSTNEFIWIHRLMSNSIQKVLIFSQYACLD